MSGMGDATANRPNRDMHGGEKLSSAASSPQMTPRVAKPVGNSADTTRPGFAPGRNHEYFEGNTVFCLGGRLQNTRHRPINIGTGFLIVLPAALFFGACAPFLWHNLSPAVPILFAYIFLISFSSFLRASSSDPGVSLVILSSISVRSRLTYDLLRSYLEIFINSLRWMRMRIPCAWRLQLMIGP
jgi:palmitoyltransferase ZDHHC9/14/18